jgi:putative ABC transport system permease protein
MAIVMGAISVVLLAITAAGIVGLTSFWVGQRRRQIGIRRALGATRHDILHYFLTENLLIGTGGVVVGVLLALGLNLWLILHFQMARLPIAYLGLGVVLLLLLGQGATLAPALRASRVPPVEATRSV